MSGKPFQQLNIYLKGGQVLSIQFNIESPEKLNTQIDDFLAKLGDEKAKGKNYIFQGSRVVMVRLDEVAAADVLNLIATPNDKAAPGQATKK